MKLLTREESENWLRSKYMPTLEAIQAGLAGWNTYSIVIPDSSTQKTGLANMLVSNEAQDGNLMLYLIEANSFEEINNEYLFWRVREGKEATYTIQERPGQDFNHGEERICCSLVAICLYLGYTFALIDPFRRLIVLSQADERLIWYCENEEFRSTALWIEGALHGHPITYKHREKNAVDQVAREEPGTTGDL